MIAIIASICLGAVCQDKLVTTSNFADISMQSCLMGAPQLAEWMKQYPGYRLAGWKCVIGKALNNI